MPPVALKLEVGSSGIGCAAYAAAAGLVTEFVSVGTHHTARLLDSLIEDSLSKRIPALIVSLGLTRQSSCAKPAKYQLLYCVCGLMLNDPEVGTPSRKLAMLPPYVGFVAPVPAFTKLSAKVKLPEVAPLVRLTPFTIALVELPRFR